MDIETVVKLTVGIVSIIGFLFAIYKHTYEITTSKKSSFKDDYRFAKEFLEDVAKKPDLHPYVIEKGYQAIAGNNNLSSKEVVYLLSLEEPSICLKDYVLSKEYLELKEVNGSFRIFLQKDTKRRGLENGESLFM